MFKRTRPYRLVISLYGNIIRCEFGSEEEARDARHQLHEKWQSVQRNRPNDPTLTAYRIISKSGEVDFDLTQVRSIYLDAGRVSVMRGPTSS